MRNDNRKGSEKSKANPKDNDLNRTFFGGPTIGRLIIAIIIIGFIVYFIFTN